MQRRYAHAGLWALLCLLVIAAGIRAAEPVEIDNGLLTVRVHPDSGTFEVRRHGDNAKPFLLDGRLGGPGKAKATREESSQLGPVQSITLQTDAGTDDLVVYKDVPFVLIRKTFGRPANGPEAIEKIVATDVQIDLGKSTDAISILGTGGLSSANKAAGSYMWLAAADPATRAGVVAGWITSERGSGVILPRVEQGKLRLKAQIDYGRLRLEPVRSERGETLAIGFFDDARLGLEAWADLVAKKHQIHLPPQPAGYCTWYHARASDAEKLAAQTAFAAEKLKPFGFSFLQIDDGWQDGMKGNGPRKNFSRVLPNGPYPAGMKPTADMIRGHGLTAGIWLTPFAGTFNDPWFADHQDWFAKREDGKPYVVTWGGTALDMTHPGARKYVADNIRRITQKWGFKYLKMDGLWMGSATEQRYVNDVYIEDNMGNAVFHDPKQTNVEVFRSAMKLAREAAGPDVFLLGCNGPQNMRSYGGSFGLLDAMRIGPDNGTGWKPLTRGPDFGTRNYHLNGRIWWNDPDPVYVRPSLPMSHARLLCSWVTVAGQLGVSSDEFAKLPPDRLDLLRRMMPPHRLPARPVDLFDRKHPRIWTVTDTAGKTRRDVVGLFNWDAAKAEIDEPLVRLGLPPEKEYAAFDFWTNALLPPIKDRLKLTLAAPVTQDGKEVKPTDAANVCAVLSVRALADHPQVISTSRHILQGLVDLSEESWDPAAATLTGTGQVVADDAYELRLLARSTAGNWKLIGVTATNDQSASITVDTKPDGDIVRVTIKSSMTGPVKWSANWSK